jgi:CRISPR/Cas system CMR-associated protein Cmr5 small subunit
LVRTAGLAQALAYIQAKASEQKKVSPAYQRLFQHVAELLGQDPAVLQEHIASVDVTKYMYYTSKVLSALIYHKRFAVSVLKVTSARETEEDLDKEGTA